MPKAGREPPPDAASGTDADTDTVIIRKYANRRLYDTSASAYITLDRLAELVRSGVEVRVVDARTGDDLTKPVLAQIILERESKGAGSLPISFLRTLITSYDSAAQREAELLSTLLDRSMDVYGQATRTWREAANPKRLMERQAARQAKLWDSAMAFWNPALAAASGGAGAEAEDGAAGRSRRGGADEDVLTLKMRIAELEAELAALRGTD